MKSSEITNFGHLAFKSGDFESAVKYFSSLGNTSRDYWNGHLYLAMSYFYLGETNSAIQVLKDICDWCPNPVLREQALAATRELHAFIYASRRN